VISVVIPVYNGKASIGRCLEALARQTRPADEIIVVDDGSPEPCDEVAAAYAVTLLHQPHRGPAAARNCGIQAARGEFILFTDADCEPSTCWIEEMLRPFEDAQVMGVKGSYQTRQREAIARLSQLEFEERYDLLERLERIDFIDTHSAAFRASALDQMGGFDEAYTTANNEDVDLSYRMAEAGHKLVFNRKAVVYHQHSARWLKYLRLKISRGYWRTITYRLHPAKVLRDAYTPQVLKIQIASLYLALGVLFLSLWQPVFAWAAAALLLLTCLLGARFLRSVWRKDRWLVFPALLFILMRSLAFGLGIITGVFGSLLFRTRIERE
jgi:glycosyltransferase involved in cell wall biosynthesis